jgi:hypothetical protein
MKLESWSELSWLNDLQDIFQNHIRETFPAWLRLCGVFCTSYSVEIMADLYLYSQTDLGVKNMWYDIPSHDKKF